MSDQYKVIKSDTHTSYERDLNTSFAKGYKLIKSDVTYNKYGDVRRFVGVMEKVSKDGGLK